MLPGRIPLSRSLRRYFLGSEQMKFCEYADDSKRLTVAIEDMPSLAYRFVRWKLCREFHLKKSGPYVKSFDEKFQKFSNNDGQVSIDWDTWSGFTVTALTSESEPLVRNMGVWLKEKYSDL